MNPLEQSMEKERLKGIRRMNLIRLWSASLFLIFFLVIDVLLKEKTWQGTTLPVLGYFTVALTSFLLPPQKFSSLS